MNFRKKVTSMKDLEQIAKQVLARMDEPLLESKRIETMLLTRKDMDHFLIAERGNSFGDAESTLGHTMKKDDVFYMRIRQMNFPETFETYFHELGHIATLDELNKMSIAKDNKAIISETLAYLFEGYAKEKFNELDYKAKFPEAKTPELSRRYIRTVIDESYLDLVHKLALENIYSLMDSLKTTHEAIYQGTKKATFK